MSFINNLVSLLGLTGAAYAACSNVLIDDFSRPTPSGLNSLGTWTSDDDSMSNITLTGGILSFTPKPDSSSYFYETLACYQAATKGYKALSLTVKGPKDASFMVEIQSKQACTDKEYKSQWVVISGLTGSPQTVSIALSSFTDANLDGITGFLIRPVDIIDHIDEKLCLSFSVRSSLQHICLSLDVLDVLDGTCRRHVTKREFILYYISKIVKCLTHLNIP
ncbi:carbohydrate esterase family 4 protein [Colletotrichum tofieldiae]|nr:carbohydrate esterase family 4 protein [Colletotrichum tofieldiae]